MKIINAEKNAKYTFSDIKNGEVFVHNGYYFLKMKEIVNNCCESVNAVFLNDGESCTFHDYERVLPVECELVIK